MSENEKNAREKVSKNERLSLNEDFIFADWQNWDEHCAWILRADEKEILEWVLAGK